MDERVLDGLDLAKNGLDRMVREDTLSYRTGPLRLNVVDAQGAPVSGARVRVELTEHEFRFGCNAFMADGFDAQEKNLAYRECFRQHFNQAVVPFYWNADEPEPGVWRFGGDAAPIYRRPSPKKALAFCREVGAQPKGHNMLWFQMPPKWLVNAPEDELWAHVADRIRRLSAAFADDIPVWDVVNEHLARMWVYEQPGGWQDTLRHLPADSPEKAFRLAMRYFPNHHLIANEDTQRTWEDFHYDSGKFWLYLENLIARGCQVDGLGMQYHLFSPEERLLQNRPRALDAENLIACQRFYARLGRAIHVSEVTVPCYAGGAKNEDLQARMVENLYRIWFSGPMNASIVWWNLVDGTASGGEDYYGGGLLRKDFSEKPAMAALRRLIHEEWHTDEQLTTDGTGHAFTRAYFGRYRITVEKNGQTEERTICFGRKDSPFVTVRMC